MAAVQAPHEPWVTAETVTSVAMTGVSASHHLRPVADNDESHAVVMVSRLLQS